jgi:hypothetical protein
MTYDPDEDAYDASLDEVRDAMVRLSYARDVTVRDVAAIVRMNTGRPLIKDMTVGDRLRHLARLGEVERITPIQVGRSLVHYRGGLVEPEEA